MDGMQSSLERIKRMAEVGRDATKISGTSWQFVAIINEVDKILNLIKKSPMKCADKLYREKREGKK